MAETENIAGQNDKSCWQCGYQHLANETFLGKCTWFSKNKKGKDKDIPPEVVDVGCKHFVQRGM
jgi:hypothetical protein